MTTSQGGGRLARGMLTTEREEGEDERRYVAPQACWSRVRGGAEIVRVTGA